MISRRVLARTIADQLLAGADQTTLVRQLAAYLIESKQTSQLDQLLGDIGYELSRHQTTHATVMTARPLDESLRTAVIAKVKSMDSSANVELEEIVDPTLIGGIIIETPDQRFDASIARELKQLRAIGQPD